MQFNIILLMLLINTGLGQDDFPALKDMVLKQKEQMAMMNESINNLMTDNNVMAISLTKVISENMDLKESVNHLTLRQAEKHAHTFISFTAYASQIRSYEEEDTVIFDQAVVNYGNFFNSSSSIFTCPASAYYLFHASLISERDNTIGSSIYLDNIVLIGAYSDGRSNTWDTGTMLIVTRCDEGSSVSVRVRVAGGLDGSSVKQTMFTGTLLAFL